MIELEGVRLHYRIGNAVSAMMGLPAAVKAVDGVRLGLQAAEAWRCAASRTAARSGGCWSG